MKATVIKQLGNMFVCELQNHYGIGFANGDIYKSQCYSFYRFAQDSQRGIQTDKEFIAEFKRLVKLAETMRMPTLS